MALDLVRQHKDFGPIYDVLYRYYESNQQIKQAEELLPDESGKSISGLPVQESQPPQQ